MLTKFLGREPNETAYFAFLSGNESPAPPNHD